MTEIRRVPFRAVLEDLKTSDLIAEYEAECSLPEMGGVCPSVQVYDALEKAGMQTFGAYIGGEIVGFATVMVYEIPHYSKKTGNTESIFVARKHRAGGAGADLMEHVERVARAEGASSFLYSAPAGSRFEKVLERRSSCRHANSVYVVKL